MHVFKINLILKRVPTITWALTKNYCDTKKYFQDGLDTQKNKTTVTLKVLSKTTLTLIFPSDYLDTQKFVQDYFDTPNIFQNYVDTQNYFQDQFDTQTSFPN